MTTMTTLEPTRAERWLQQRVGSMRELRSEPTGYAPMLRDAFVAKFGFGVLTARAIDDLIDLIGPDAQILEVGAGSGYWAYELQAAGLGRPADGPGLYGRHVDGAEAKRVRLGRVPDGRRGGGGVRTGLHPHDGVARDGLLARRHAGGVPRWSTDSLRRGQGRVHRQRSAIRPARVWMEGGRGGISIPTFPWIFDGLTVWRRRGS